MEKLLPPESIYKMGMSYIKPMEFPNELFETREDAINEYRKMLTDCNCTNYDALYTIVKDYTLFPKEQISFKVGWNDTYQVRQFLYKTGPIDWRPLSYSKKLEYPEAKEGRAKLIKTMRNLVYPQIKEFREWSQRNNQFRCAITGKFLQNKDAVVDHHNPYFIEIAEEWLNYCISRGGTWEQLTEYANGFRFTSILLNESWTKYHQRRANLRMLCREENLKRENKPQKEYQDRIFKPLIPASPKKPCEESPITTYQP